MTNLASEQVPAPVSPGDLLAGKYRIERVIGRGGMSVLFAAKHVALDQQVAVKFLLPSMAAKAESVGRFLREARAVARLRSRHVAGVLDVGTAPGGTPYMVIEYLEGADLAQVCEAKGRLPVTESVDYIMQALDAVAEAHVNGVVHRDLKPSNLFVAEEAEGLVVKVLDFGISKESGDILGPDAKLTQSQTIIGSPLYMSPEQIRSSRAVDVRSDLWSLGVILYELLAGRTPFAGETMGELFACILEVDFPPLPFLRPDVPAPLAEAVHRCLRRPLDRRFQDAGELARALAPYATPRLRPLAESITAMVQNVHLPRASLSASLREARTTRSVHASVIIGQAPALEQTGKNKARSWLALGLAAAGLTGGIGMTAWALGVRHNERLATSPSSVSSLVSVGSPPLPSPGSPSFASAGAPATALPPGSPSDTMGAPVAAPPPTPLVAPSAAPAGNPMTRPSLASSASSAAAPESGVAPRPPRRGRPAPRASAAPIAAPREAPPSNEPPSTSVLDERE
jgi:serine/threonine-protein kinase